MDPDLTQTIKQAIEDALLARGNANVLIAGRTGVGKSTLVNAIFEGNLAETGQGRPVTKETREYRKEGVPVTILDTRGLEVARYQEIITELGKLVGERRRETDPNRHIHVAWLCIMEDARRVEEAETELVKMLERHGVPVIGVLTKSRSDRGFRADVQRLLPTLCNVTSVLAQAEVDDDGHVRPAKGLDKLVELTMGALPEGQRNAFVAAQKVSLDLKVNRAHACVAAAALSAGTTAAIPIPFLDTGAIVTIEMTMLAGISAIFGLPLNRTLFGTLITGTVSGAAGSLGRKAVLGELLKLIPGAGTLAGGALGAATAATFTTVCGEAYIGALRLLLQKNPDQVPAPEAIGKAFREELRVSGKSWTGRIMRFGRKS